MKGVFTGFASVSKDVLNNLLLCIFMLILTVGGIAYAIVRDVILEDRYGKHNMLVHANFYETAVTLVVLLAAPFLGACGSFRLTRSTDRSTKFAGWLFLMIFSLLFLQSVLSFWSQYRSYIWIVEN